jgi:UDP-N-acetylglucosamine--N-acetylmuramyl-(pentapeptide) pyrophosphoryl-undecaprenol N-acetylglucosamine transferase
MQGSMQGIMQSTMQSIDFSLAAGMESSENLSVGTVVDLEVKVLICAGGTGGGIYPGLAAASELRRLGLGKDELHWVGTGGRYGEMEESLVPRAGVKLVTIAGGAIVGVRPDVMIMNGIKSIWGVVNAVQLIRRFRPDVVFMTGGYVAVPVTLAAWWQRVPICIYLPDVEPGAAIKFGLRFARKVACTTEGSRAYVPPEKMVVTGYPVRPELRQATGFSREEALSRFDLKPGRPTLFVFGGSRGARSINRALMANLPELLAKIQVIHISGTFTWPEVKENAEALSGELKAFYRAYPYLHKRMGAAFHGADLVVARAGASMLGEGPAFGLPAILIPYPHAWRYQKVNADYLTDAGAAVQLADEKLQDELFTAVMGLLNDERRLAQMAKAARALDKPDGVSQLARLILAVGQGGNA